MLADGMFAECLRWNACDRWNACRMHAMECLPNACDEMPTDNDKLTKMKAPATLIEHIAILIIRLLHSSCFLGSSALLLLAHLAVFNPSRILGWHHELPQHVHVRLAITVVGPQEVSNFVHSFLKRKAVNQW